MARRWLVVAAALAVAAVGWTSGAQETEFTTLEMQRVKITVLVPKSVPGEKGATAVAAVIAPKPGADAVKTAIAPDNPKVRTSIAAERLANLDIYVKDAAGTRVPLAKSQVYVEVVVDMRGIPDNHEIYVLRWDAANPSQSYWVPVNLVASGKEKIPGLRIERVRRTAEECRFIVTDWPLDDMEVAHG